MAYLSFHSIRPLWHGVLATIMVRSVGDLGWVFICCIVQQMLALSMTAAGQLGSVHWLESIYLHALLSVNLSYFINLEST